MFMLLFKAKKKKNSKICICGMSLKFTYLFLPPYKKEHGKYKLIPRSIQ